jgi:hypothetical protein
MTLVIPRRVWIMVDHNLLCPLKATLSPYGFLDVSVHHDLLPRIMLLLNI